MIPALDLLLAAAAFLGHFGLAVYLFNRLHSRPWRWKLVKALARSILTISALVVAAYAVRAIAIGGFYFDWATGASGLLTGPWLWYAIVAWAAAASAVPLWLWPKLLARQPALLVSNDTEIIDVREKLGRAPIDGRRARFLARIPGNEAFRLNVQRKTLQLTDLPPQLDGLTIGHLSDLHMTGELTEDFYREIVEATNVLSPDLIAITGDIVEKTRCLPWIDRTLGRLEARLGKWFVLGNHDRRLPDEAGLRRVLTSAGIQDLGSRSQQLTINDVPVLLAGVELPWFGRFPLPLGEGQGEGASQIRNPKSEIRNSSFRLLLSHTPDHLPWARRHAFDLMLAGHNHGGQIRLPGLGALITPSRYGFRYAGGLYHEPPTVLHVSRGLSGLPPIRLNCPPEIALLVLRRAP